MSFNSMRAINPSYSGGPLFDPETGDVIGIITRSATGPTNVFAELRTAIQGKPAEPEGQLIRKP